MAEKPKPQTRPAAPRKPAKGPAAGKAADPGLSPWDREEIPLEQLPPLVFPGSDDLAAAAEMASQNRRRRLRIEIYGGVIILVAGVVFSVVLGIPAPFIIALLAAAAILAYEFLVVSLE